MNVSIRGRNTKIAEEIQDYARQKLTKVVRVLDDQATNIEIELYSERNPSIAANQVAEVTIYTKGPIIRARDAESDMYAAIDRLANKLERQVGRLHGRIRDRRSVHAGKRLTEGIPTVDVPEDEQREPEIVKRKVHAYKPMTAEEAVMQMELLGHDFFVFTDAESEAINVLYRRRDGDYGVIEQQR